jgi:hypothetical protein
MSVQSCQDFLRVASDSPELGRELKASTAIGEIVKIGRRHGYAFSDTDLMRGSSSLAGPAIPPQQEAAPAATRFFHHEYDLADIPGLAAVADELPLLEITPPSVDLARFDATFRGDDLATTSQAPADPAFRAWHERMAALQWRDPALADPPRRDFHLVNLDEHSDHAGYEEYFAAKIRVVAALEEFFRTEIRFSGALWYPPSSYRLWHTNENQPGWRMYIVDVDAPFDDPEETSYFRYQNPQTGEIVTLRERQRIVRFFKAEQDPLRLFWHCIVNPTERHRWSFGFVVPEGWQDALERNP